jgi:hypothetical protein
VLFVQDTKVTGNVVENPSGVGIYVRDAKPHSGNTVVDNTVIARTQRTRTGVLLEDAPGARTRRNHFILPRLASE